MNNSKRNFSMTSIAAAVALLVSGGAAVAQDAAGQDYDRKAADTYQMDSTKDKHAEMAEKWKKDSQQMTSAFGVSELNDIENWKITNSGEELGEIDRIGVDRTTGELLAVVGLEGVVGVNMKEVGIPLKDLTKSGDETLSTTLTKSELQQQRDIDPWDGSYSQILSDKATQ